MRDENQIAFGILRTVTTTEPRAGETPMQRQGRANGLLGIAYGALGGPIGVARVTPAQRRENGLKGAIARWGTIRDNQPMPASRKNLDMNQLAKRILDEATGDEPKTEAPALTPRQENSRQGGIIGGVSRAAKLTPEQRSEIAKKAAQGRWNKD
jgi:hypothetical protein